MHPEIEEAVTALAEGRQDDAYAKCMDVFTQHPDNADACFEQLVVAEESGHTSFVMRVYEQLVAILPQHKKLYRKVIARLDKLRGRGAQYYADGINHLNLSEYDAAIAAFQRAQAEQANFVDAMYCEGLAYYNLRRLEECRQVLERCLAIAPNHPEALNVMGCVHHLSGQYDEAIHYYRQVVALRPDYLLAHSNIGILLGDNKRYNEAIAAYEEALVQFPDSVAMLMELVQWRRRTCNWQGLKPYEDRLIERIDAHGESATPFNIGVYFDAPALQLKNARQFMAQHFPRSVAHHTDHPLPATLRDDARLRVGYVSGDFNDHATAYLVCELFELADKTQFDIRAYCTGNLDESPAGQRMRGAFSSFTELAPLTAQQAADRVRDDGIDILIDMSGYSNKNRLDMFALHPAPVQMHYIGCPSTSGSNFIDYYLTDAIASPEGHEQYFSEALIRLPHSYQINDRKRFLPTVIEPRSQHGLPEDAFVFGAFNGEFKNTEEIFALWMRLLKAVPGSVLWIYAPLAETQHNLANEAIRHGIDPARIIYATGVGNAQHLTRLRCVDLFLDTFPCVSHTTASDVLWSAVPMVTMAGEAFCSRVAASLLHATGLPELITHNITDYEKLALELARDDKRRAHIRDYLEARRMELPLFDSLKTTRAIEAAYQHAASLYRLGVKPHSFKVNSDLSIASSALIT